MFGTFEARNTLVSLLDRVEQGEEIVITRYGKPVARLTACLPSVGQEEVRAALDRIRARARELNAEPIAWETLKAESGAGRR